MIAMTASVKPVPRLLAAIERSAPGLTLLTGMSGSVQVGPDPEVVRLPLQGHSTKTVKKKALVGPGTLVAEHPDPELGDVHSPITGIVTGVTDSFVEITAREGESPRGEDAAPTVFYTEPVNLSALDGDDLRKALKASGISTKPFAKAATLIINGLNPDPGTGIAELLLREFRDTLQQGLLVVRKLVEPAELLMAVADGNDRGLEGSTARVVPPVYPNSLEPLVIKALTGKEKASSTTVVSVMELYAVGRVAETGLPLTETLLTAGGAAFRVKVGTPMAAVLNKAGLAVSRGDRVVVGGPMRGETVHGLEDGASKDDFSVTVVPQAAFRPLTDKACINCGECTLVCPARIMPGFVARYIEFGMFKKAKEFHIDACMECGLCGFVCTARRPMVQLIRLGKKALGIPTSPFAPCRLQGSKTI